MQSTATGPAGACGVPVRKLAVRASKDVLGSAPTHRPVRMESTVMGNSRKRGRARNVYVLVSSDVMVRYTCLMFAM